MREIDGSCIHCVTIGAKPLATRRRSRSFVPLFRQTERSPKFEFTQPSTFCGPIPERMFVPRRGTRANSCVTSIPNVDSAITTDAGPQLFSDCQTCFISSNTTEAGAALGSGAGIATATGSSTRAGAVAATCAESDAPSLERLSLTEVVREARAAASAGLGGLLLFGISDRKDEHAMLASEPDHVVPRAIRAVKEAVPELGVATDVCVCAYTAHGQCVLFGDHGADVARTLERLAAIAEVHADAGADLLIPSGMLEGTVHALRDVLGPRRADVPIAAT